MLLDETCFFLAADFDKSTWQKDAVAFLKTCQQKKFPDWESGIIDVYNLEEKKITCVVWFWSQIYHGQFRT